MSEPTPSPTAPPANSPATSAIHAPRKRTAPDAAANERATWLTGTALALVLGLIVAVLGMIFVKGSATFWPRAIERIELVDGSVFLGIENAREIGPDGERVQLLVGNRDLGNQTNRWVDSARIARRTTPSGVVFVERDNWGAFLGEPGRLIEQTSDGAARVLADGRDATAEALPGAMAEAAARQRQIARLAQTEIPRIESRIASLRTKLRGLEIEQERAESATSTGSFMQCPGSGWSWS